MKFASTILPLLAAISSAQDLRRTPIVVAVQRVAPAVVNISSEQRTNPYASDDPFFSQFFHGFFDVHPGNYSQTSLGSGVIIDARGYVLTNEHVIQKGTKIQVTLADKREFAAKVVGSDADADLAVLQIEGGTLPAVKMGTSSDLMIGETVIAIGNPYGLSHTVTTGIVSALNRSIKSDEGALYDLIQTDASINPGNSGGPLLNINGDLIGINTAIYQNAQGIGFAIPIDRVKRAVADLISLGALRRAWLGLQVDVERDWAGNGRAMRAVDVVDGGPAAAAGLRVGDEIQAVNGKTVRTLDDYNEATANLGVGDAVSILAQRRGTPVKVALGASDFTDEIAKMLCRRYFGLSVEPIDRASAARFGLSGLDGVVITAVEPTSRAAKLGFRRGIVIREINGSDVVNIHDFTRAMSRVRRNQGMLLMVQLGDSFYRVKLFVAQ